MDELIEVVLRNPFLLLLLIGGLISVFRDKKPDQTKQRRAAEQRRVEQSKQVTPTPDETPPEQQSGETIFDMLFDEVEEQKEPSSTTKETQLESLSVEEQRDEQLERLQAELGAQQVNYDPETADVADTDADSIEVKSIKKLTKSKQQKRKLHDNLKKRLTKEGLVESVIMAEILGRPRSKRSHHRHL